MGSSSRRKGRDGEHESTDVLRAAGWHVRPIQRNTADTGDWIATRGNVRLVGDTKRTERVRIIEASRQVEKVAQPGDVPCVVYRSNREPWRVSFLLADVAELLGGEKTPPHPDAVPQWGRDDWREWARRVTTELAVHRGEAHG